MRRLTLAVALVVSLTSPVWAGFDDGVGAYLRGDYATALQEFRRLAEQGDATAQYNLGVMYLKGFGVAQDYAEAVKWYRLAADQGDITAQLILGNIYLNGKVVQQDASMAARWFLAAAEQGDALAQSKLGIMYGMGQGVPEDFVQSHLWSNLAASKFPPGEARDSAAEFRDAVYVVMTPAQVAEAQRLAREWLANHGAKQ